MRERTLAVRLLQLWRVGRPCMLILKIMGSCGFLPSQKMKRMRLKLICLMMKMEFLLLLQGENLPICEQDDRESWLDIITSLSWEAASNLKPDTSKGGGMDPGGYVKIKCVACGRRSESVVIKGVVCKKNVAHRRMTTTIYKPRILILGGALEYQRVSTHLSSFDTLLQQEVDHLKMAVAKIDAYHPKVLLVEKSVSRFAQDFLLEKDISLVLNIKRPLLERIARCTGTQIVPSVDHILSQNLGYCEKFFVEKFFEEHGSAGQGGKKLTKTLMFFEGCPKPLGCTILLKGASGDELKKVKHVIQYAVFAAYHLALETSFLADEGASLPELPLKSPITVALPDKASNTGNSITVIPDFTISAKEKSQTLSSNNCSLSVASGLDADQSTNLCTSGSSQNSFSGPVTVSSSFSSLSTAVQDFPGVSHNQSSEGSHTKQNTELGCMAPSQSQIFDMSNAEDMTRDVSTGLEAIGHDVCRGLDGWAVNHHHTSRNVSSDKDHEDTVLSKGVEFPSSVSDSQSILVSLSTRCVWKGTVCERAHLLRIKYYGSFDKPLGRYLQDQLFDNSYRCSSCEMPSEAHVHCYTHQQGSLTISVKKFPEALLPGDGEGKIWMWHRCLLCPRTNGYPPATRRVLMSDAAWGLSFGKFLELSFSNHAAASRVASCGHSLHRDCLRFYGYGRMVACFRYASIELHSVYLPPPRLEFDHSIQEWIQKEVDEIKYKSEVLFTEIRNSLSRITEKLTNGLVGNNSKAPCFEHVALLEAMFNREKDDFEESLTVLQMETSVGKPIIDILEMNKLRRLLLLLAYAWDQRLINAASSKSINSSGTTEKFPSSDAAFGSVPSRVNIESKDSESFSRANMSLDYEENGSKSDQSDALKGTKQLVDLHKEAEASPPSITNIFSQSVETERTLQKVISQEKLPIISNLSDTLDAAWTGENYNPSTAKLVNNSPSSCSLDLGGPETGDNSYKYKPTEDRFGAEAVRSFSLTLAPKGSLSFENSTWSALSASSSFEKISQKLSLLAEYNPTFITSFQDLARQGGARLFLPLGVNGVVVPVYDDEPTSIISYALVSPEYYTKKSELEKSNESLESAVSLPLFESLSSLSVNSLKETGSSSKSLEFSDENTSGSQNFDPLLRTADSHIRVSFMDDGPLGKVRFTVTCYYAKRFEALRRICCPSELDFVRSLSRCKKWGAQGGKSNVFFAKTLDDRFIIKQVTKTELESFIQFAPAYFKYLSESISTKSPTCLAKILGIYQVVSKNLKSGKESRMDVLVMENLLYKRTIRRLYDLKGSARSRYNADPSGTNKVLLDQNLIEAMPTSPIFVGNRAKRHLERAVWNDTSFLASIDVMDYSLLVGVDEEKRELVLGIIDFMRQYTWDKHLETWVKTSGILGGPKNTSPTVISPKQYKKRFRKAMTAYFLMVPDQWSPPLIIPSKSQADLYEENSKGGDSLEQL
uniref:1-phosphatidylinositol-3-phosphate 5-kinase n=1 Tax=Kalanchoe fedtschenkoi TaxID=63787 RepID=A0A7N0UWF1_KALFE